MLWWEMESWRTKKWGIGEKRSRTAGLEYFLISVSYFDRHQKGAYLHERGAIQQGLIGGLWVQLPKLPSLDPQLCVTVRF